jgi:hypothetical protein
MYTYSMAQKTLYVREADLSVWEAAQKQFGETSMSTQVIEALREKLSSRDLPFHRVPIGVGNANAQARFIGNNRDFLLEHPHLHELCGGVVRRSPKPPREEDVDKRVDDKVTADSVIFAMGLVIIDDFRTVITLSGNACGFGALQVLRGMYERVVTSVYFAKKPNEARAFVDDDKIQRWKLWKRALEVWPNLKGTPPAGLEEHEADYRALRAKRAESVCRKCGQPKTQEAWTLVDLASMAEQADANLAKFYRDCYLEPTYHSHPTMFGLGERFRPTEDGRYSYAELSEPQARKALRLAHYLILYWLTFQNDYFGLGLADELNQRYAAYQSIWSSADQPAAAG